MQHDISIPLLHVLVSAFIALLVVVLSHAFTLRRDRQNRRQEQRIDYLVSVYRALGKANQNPRLYEVAEELEQAVADVELFGTPTQVALARRFTTDLGTRQSAAMDDLLVELRDSLRAELGAAPLSGRHLWVCVERKKEDGDEDEPASRQRAQ
jgi:hypothetical protein